jgi:hypothetical protein
MLVDERTIERAAVGLLFLFFFGLPQVGFAQSYSANLHGAFLARVPLAVETPRMARLGLQWAF